jgi:hypothetical protein
VRHTLWPHSAANTLAHAAGPESSVTAVSITRRCPQGPAGRPEERPLMRARTNPMHPMPAPPTMY